jgi:hypothetical protein
VAWASGLGAISRRVVPPTGFTTIPAWNLNPNDQRWDGSSQARDYIAAVALKATTAVDGAPISVYNHNNADGKGGTGLVDARKLNDCEAAGGETFYADPDLASSGTVGALMVDLAASPATHARCAWMGAMGIPVARMVERAAADGARCASFAIGPHRVGLNVADSFGDRQLCDVAAADVP